jgi:hypothetical protein
MERRSFFSRLLGGAVAAVVGTKAKAYVPAWPNPGSYDPGVWKWDADLKDWVTLVRVPMPQNIGPAMPSMCGQPTPRPQRSVRKMTSRELNDLASGNPLVLYQEYGVRSAADLLRHYGVRPA